MAEYEIVRRLREPKQWQYYNGYALNFESKAPYEAADTIETLAAALEPVAAFADEETPNIWKHEGIRMALINYDVMRQVSANAREALAKLKGEMK